MIVPFITMGVAALNSFKTRPVLNKFFEIKLLDQINLFIQSKTGVTYRASI